MQDWATHLDRILTMSGEQLLQGNGSISRKQAIRNKGNSIGGNAL